MSPPNAGREPRSYRYDPELPFLYALEREVRRQAQQAARARERSRAHNGVAQTAPVPSLARARTRRGVLHQAGSRVARRSLALVALLCLIGASAYGARQILADGPTSPAVVHQSALVPVAQGRAGVGGPDNWSLRLYVRGDELCRVMVVGEAESSRCSMAPGAHLLGVTSVVSPSRRYMYGVAGAGVARVAVRAGGATLSVPTHAPPATAAHAAGLPRGARWFLAVLGRPVAEPDREALVRGLSAAGRPTTGTLHDCPESPEPQPCPR